MGRSFYVIAYGFGAHHIVPHYWTIYFCLGRSKSEENFTGHLLSFALCLAIYMGLTVRLKECSHLTQGVPWPLWMERWSRMPGSLHWLLSQPSKWDGNIPLRPFLGWGVIFGLGWFNGGSQLLNCSNTVLFFPISFILNNHYTPRRILATFIVL